MIYDISPVLNAKSPVWPGDTSLERKKLLEISKGANIELSTLCTTVHIGAHVDAPSHYIEGAKSIEKLSLESFLGRCRVLEMRGSKPITAARVKLALKDNSFCERILFKTGSFKHNMPFGEEFASLTVDAVEFLGQQKCRLIGLDTPSFDEFSSKELPTHFSLAENGIINLEGLDLSLVPEGEYELIALPLKLEGFEASPVRAILRDIN